MGKITDQKSVEAWLRGEDRQTHICFAARAALRGFPGVGGAVPATLGSFAFFAARAIIISAVAGKMPTADMSRSAAISAFSAGSASSAARSATGSAFSAASSAASAAFSASSAALSASSAALSASSAAFSASSAGSAAGSARSAAFSAAYWDTEQMVATGDPATTFDHPIWPDRDMPKGLSANLQNLRDFWQNAPEVWGFWERWYDGFLNGTPLDWDVQLAVASLPDEDWKKGPEWNAGKIAEIERDFLSNKTPLAETIEYNRDTNKFHAVPLDIAKPDLVAATLSQLSDALDDVLANPSNGLTAQSREVRVAQRTLEKYADDPQQIELNLVSVAVGLRRQMFDTHELPQTEENRSLLQTAEDGAIAIRATHPVVAENREILAQQKFVELSQSDKDLLEAAKEPLLLLSEWQMADDFAHDIPALLNTSIGPSGNYAPELPGVIRTFGRIARISEKIEKDGLVDRIEGHKAYRALRIAGVGGSVTALFAALVRLGLRLFDVL